MNWERYGLRLNPPVFFISAALILAFVVFGAGFTTVAAAVFETILETITHIAGWFYILAVAFFLVFVIGLAFSPYSAIRLGPDDEEPEFSYGSWIAMLFSAGMGIGLLFFSVAEPVQHYMSPPSGAAQTGAALEQAMQLTFVHWGLHAWAIYIVVGLSLAYFSFRHGLPLTVRSSLYPLLRERIYGPIGDAVDIFAVLGTMFGVATSLGFGAMQVNAGLSFLFGVPEANWVRILIICGITLLATISVVSGLGRGIRRLSEFNIFMGFLLVVFVFLAGPTSYLLNAFLNNVGNYLSSLVTATFDTSAYNDTEWIGSWKIFYWAWWISWSPFVGMFIARVSKGRTIREFIIGVLLVPVGVTFIWMTVFGNTALYLDQMGMGSDIITAVETSIPTSLFALLQHFPLSGLFSLLATVVVITFFVTSSDSGSLVIDILTAGGDPDPPVSQRIFWALSEGGVAATLLLAGGLTALQTAAVSAALPFTVVMLFICWGLLRGLQNEHHESLAIPDRKRKKKTEKEPSGTPDPSQN